MNHNTYQFSESRRMHWKCSPQLTPNLWTSGARDLGSKVLRKRFKTRDSQTHELYEFFLGGTSLLSLFLRLIEIWPLSRIKYRSPWHDRPPTNNIMILQTCSDSLHWTWNLVSCGSLCHCGNFSNDTSYDKVNEYCHGWWMSSSIGHDPTFTWQQLVMKYGHGWLKFGWKNHVVSDSHCTTVNL